MGQGYALSGELPVGQRSPAVAADRLPAGWASRRALNATTVRSRSSRIPFAEGPYGAKGISEIATVPSTPAILNAVHDATGVRVYDLPVDPERLRAAMAESPPGGV